MRIEERKIRILDLVWDGPFSTEDACEAVAAKDYGLYQIYGTHAIFGPDSLLYIGRSTESDRRFGTRIAEHCEQWIKWENRIGGVYFGRLGGTIPLESSQHEDWGKAIDIAAGLLIYYCSPPYNSAGLRKLPVFEPTIVLNFKHRHRLPMMVSNLYEQSPVESSAFKPYSV